MGKIGLDYGEKGIDVEMVLEVLTKEEIKRCWCIPVTDLDEAVVETIKSYGAKAKVAIIPNGLYVLARVRKNV